MKSDREFLNGIYVKVEQVTYDSVLDFNLIHKKHNPTMKRRRTTRYIKYAGLAASFLLLVSSAVFFSNYKETNNQISDTPAPANIRMVNYSEQLIDQSTDIRAVEACSVDGIVEVKITEDFKNSVDDLQILKIVDSNTIGLKEGQSAIIFLKSDSANTEILDIFLWNKDNGIYTNQYGETIEIDTLYNIKQ